MCKKMKMGHSEVNNSKTAEDGAVLSISVAACIAAHSEGITEYFAAGSWHCQDGEC